MKAELTNSGSGRHTRGTHALLISLVTNVFPRDASVPFTLPFSQLMDCSVRMRPCSGPVALEMSKSVPRKLLVAAV